LSSNLNFPTREFTIKDLEAANPKIDTLSVRVQLAEAIATGKIEVVDRGDKAALGTYQFTYRRAE
jgi:hypothetical protein